MAGYVARDKLGNVSGGEVAPSARWREEIAHKTAAFAAIPDTADNAVYMDELLNYLETKYAAASDNWLGGVCLDNEPALWPSTHPLLHPGKPTCQELINRSVALATALKNIDAKPLLFGPVTYGFGEMYDFQTAADWASLKGAYSWFVDLYLDKMKAASQAAGKRLVDVFDFHWYSEAQGNGERIVGAANPSNRANAEARIQAPRTLWDPHYLENSWIAQWNSGFLPIIPKVKTSIAAYYPDTKLSISEYNYGGENHISGGLALADALGIYGKYGVDFGFYWQTESPALFTSAAFKLYRNYNGSNGTFGSVSINASTSDSVRSSAYASVVSSTNAELHLVLLNKNYDSAMNATVTIAGPVAYQTARVWSFDSTSATINERLPAPAITGNSFTCAIPRLTACHVVLTPSSAAMTGIPLPGPNGCRVRVAAGRLFYSFPGGENGDIALYALDGTLLKEWRSISGNGAIDFDNRIATGLCGSAVLTWNSKSGNGALKVLIAR
jgi:mannan endo-1,4-beta-mannosidase